MNKYPLTSKKAEQAAGLILICIVFGCLVLSLTVFSPPESGLADSPSVAPVHINYLPSTADIQRELNRRGYKLKVDGVCGPATQAAWDAECGNQYAIEFMIEEMK